MVAELEYLARSVEMGAVLALILATVIVVVAERQR